MSEDRRTPEPGDLLDGKYHIESRLGEGGFATVYLARHAGVRSLTCAVKVLRATYASDAEAVRRFRHEAETAAALRSRHTVRITDVGDTASGLPYMVMEYVDGTGLDEILLEEGPLPPARAARWIIDVLRAVEEAHERGIVHRDLKPSNVLVVEEPGEERPIARVLDFGIAKVLEPSAGLEGGPQTQADLVMCTPNYAAPELLVGNASYQSDLYALGHMLAELLDGECPYSGGAPIEIATRQMSLTPVPLGPRAEASGLVPVLRRALAKNMGERFVSAAQMREALSAALPRLSEEIPAVPSVPAPPPEHGLEDPTRAISGASAHAAEQDPTAAVQRHAPSPVTRAMSRVSTPILAGLIAIGLVLTALVLALLRPNHTADAIDQAHLHVAQAVRETSRHGHLTSDVERRIILLVNGEPAGRLPLEGAFLPVQRPVELTIIYPGRDGDETRVVHRIERDGPIRWHASRTGALREVVEAEESSAGEESSRESAEVPASAEEPGDDGQDEEGARTRSGSTTEGSTTGSSTGGSRGRGGASSGGDRRPIFGTPPSSSGSRGTRGRQ